MIIDLAKVYRANRIESIHYGIAIHVGTDGMIQSWGDASFSCYTRSLIKPIQAFCASNAGLNLKDEALAIAMASHLAEDDQLNAVKKLMLSHGIEEDDLKCGCKSSRRGDLKSPVYHNCSGKHSAMIAASKINAWDIEGYCHSEHPLQQIIIKEVQRLLKDASDIPLAMDGCALPTLYLSLEQMGQVFVNLVGDPKYQEIIETMNKYPFLIGGERQMDSLIMNLRPGEFIAKVGAEGLIMVTNLKKQETLILKIIDGSYRARSTVIQGLMESLSWIDKGELDLDFSIYNSPGDKVGHIEFCLDI